MPFAALLVYFLILVLLVWHNMRTNLLPDMLTWSGVLCGLATSALFPQLHGASQIHASVMSSLGGAAVGFLAAWAVCELGKMIFGTSLIRLPLGMEFQLIGEQGRYRFILNSSSCDFEEIFSRFKDRLTISKIEDLRVATSVAVETDGITNIAISHDSLWLGGVRVPLEEITHLSGVCGEVKVPREVMGFAIVKLMAFVGAFLGWQGALCVFVLSFAVFFLTILLANRFLSQRQLPFVPFVMVASIGYAGFVARFF